MKTLLCKIGLHDWNHCKCNRCGVKRGFDHQWLGCKCGTCGNKRDVDHNWSECRCRICGKTRHIWKVINLEKKSCSTCEGSGQILEEPYFPVPGEYYYEQDQKPCSKCGGKGGDFLEERICIRCGSYTFDSLGIDPAYNSSKESKLSALEEILESLAPTVKEKRSETSWEDDPDYVWSQHPECNPQGPVMIEVTHEVEYDVENPEITIIKSLIQKLKTQV